MPVISKKKRIIAEQVASGKVYTLLDAVNLLKKLPSAKFRESVDIAINLGVDPRKSDQAVRGSLVLPNGTGRQIRVAVFTTPSHVDDAKKAGADIVGLEDLAEQIKAGEINFDVVVATPDAMRIVGQLGQILGPRGLMPNPKDGTVTPDVVTAIKNAKAGQVRYRTDKAGVVHCTAGKVDFEVSAIIQNIESILTAIKKAKPSSAKGVYLKKIVVSSTMGPGLQVEVSSISA